MPDLHFEAQHFADRPGEVVATAGAGHWAFYTGTSPEAMGDRPAAEGKGPRTFHLAAPSGWRRLFVRPVCDGVAEPLWTERRLPFPRLMNFRDLGGYASRVRDPFTERPQRVRWGQIYRTAHWSSPTSTEAEALASLAIDTLIDFRGGDERAREPDHVPANVRRVVHLPIEAGDLAHDARVHHILKHRDTKRAHELMREIYAGLTTRQTPVYTAFFAALAASEGPVAFHCTAGKDRTGVAAALLLTALGVRPGEVLADYVLSTALLRDSIPEHMIEEGARPFLGVSPGYLRAGLKAARKTYGSMARYFREKLDVDVESLRRRFLTVDPPPPDAP